MLILTMVLVWLMFTKRQRKQGIEVPKTPHEGDKADYSAEVGVLSSAGGDALVVVGYLDQAVTKS